ncbi:MAG TPA: hypothetical protein PKY30_23095 [Myxococcota bacterium]|nr:hypothetical protein [Myxococcota bacterium]HNH49949.1 hypothetical protein [Myxococcota bacterium]
MARTHKLLVVALGLLTLAGAGGYAYVSRQPKPAGKEEKFEDISPEDMERWMQDIGYTE